jgi:hypothetical protein
VHIQPKKLIVDTYVAKELAFLKQQAKSFVTTCLINTVKTIDRNQRNQKHFLNGVESY